MQLVVTAVAVSITMSFYSIIRGQDLLVSSIPHLPTLPFTPSPTRFSGVHSSHVCLHLFSAPHRQHISIPGFTTSTDVFAGHPFPLFDMSMMGLQLHLICMGQFRRLSGQDFFNIYRWWGRIGRYLPSGRSIRIAAPWPPVPGSRTRGLRC